MKTLLPTLLIATLLLTPGCMRLAPVVKALSTDPAFVTVDVKTISASARVVRDGRAQNGNTVSAEGVTSVQPTSSTPTPPPIIHYIYVTNTVREVAVPAAPQPRVTNPRRVPGGAAARRTPSNLNIVE